MRKLSNLLAVMVIIAGFRLIRKAAKNFLKYIFKNPLNLFRKSYLQTFTIIQPVDIMKDGSMNMCDSCPDITVHNGELYWSCRLEEVKEYGCFVSAVPNYKLQEELKNKCSINGQDQVSNSDII